MAFALRRPEYSIPARPHSPRGRSGRGRLTFNRAAVKPEPLHVVHAATPSAPSKALTRLSTSRLSATTTSAPSSFSLCARLESGLRTNARTRNSFGLRSACSQKATPSSEAAVVTHSKGGWRAVKGKAVAKEMKANSPTDMARGNLFAFAKRKCQNPASSKGHMFWHPWALVLESGRHPVDSERFACFEQGARRSVSARNDARAFVGGDCEGLHSAASASSASTPASSASTPRVTHSSDCAERLRSAAKT